MTTVLDYSPTEPGSKPSAKQEKAHTCSTRWTGYGGAEFGGKTLWLVQEALCNMLEYPGVEVLLGRYDYSELVSPTQVRDTFFSILPKNLIQGDPYMSSPSWVKLHNNSRATFAGLKDYHPSSAFGILGIDQAEEVPELIVRTLSGRVRQQLPGLHRRILLTFNPHPNIEWFLKSCDLYPKSFTFIQSLPHDNPIWTPEFNKERKEAYTEDQYRRLIEGHWDVFKGQALPEFNRNVHVIEPFDTWLTQKWPVARGIDWGLSALTVCEWITRSPDGDLFFCQEYAEANQPPDVHAKAIAAMSIGMALGGSWIDPRTAQVQDVRKNRNYDDNEQWSVFREFRLNGVYCQLAQGKRENRLAAWKRALAINPSRRDFRTHLAGAPQVYIMKNCERLIWELPRLKYREAIQGYSDDIMKQEDHAYDAGGFVLSHVIDIHPAIGPRDKGRMMIGKR